MLTRFLPLADHGFPWDRLLLPRAFFTRSIFYKWQKQIKILNYAHETALPSASSLRFHWMILYQIQGGLTRKKQKMWLPIYLLPQLSCRSGTTVLQIGDDGERAGDHRIRNLVHNASPMHSTPRRGEGLLRLLPCPALLLHKINITSTTIDTSKIVDIIAITNGELTMIGSYWEDCESRPCANLTCHFINVMLNLLMCDTFAFIIFDSIIR